MKITTALVVALTVLGSTAFAGKGKGCHFADMGRLKEHLEKHITYPSTGKDIKAACMKEWPDEFSKEEHSCADSKLKDTAKYKNSKEVLKALGV